MWVKMRGKVHEVDARPSDAITLALRTKAPIFVTPELLENNRTLLTSDSIVPRLEEFHRKALEKHRIIPIPEEVEMEWRSFRSLPRGGEDWLKTAEK
jgi:Domain of unknown function (DUF151)